MAKASGLTLVVLLAAAAAWYFEFIATEQILYLVTMIAGWTAWTCLVALAYAGLEKLFPNLLCAHAAEGP